MSVRLLALAGVLLVVAPAGAAAAGKRNADPNLWATINICDPASQPGAAGVRVSIPQERRSPHQWARIQVQFFDSRARRWRRVRIGGDGGWARLGAGRGVVQGGTTFTFTPPAAGQRLTPARASSTSSGGAAPGSSTARACAPAPGTPTAATRRCAMSLATCLIRR